MSESMIVEAIRAAGAPKTAGFAQGAQGVAGAADPQAVERFQAAMAVEGVAGVDKTGAVPFASEISAAWQSAKINNQGLLHRIRALTEMRNEHSVAAAEMVELQYNVMNLTFQQEVVTKISDKASNAIQTLIKNQ